MDDYNRSRHAKYNMNVHLIFVTKYRKCVFLSEEIADAVKQSLYEAAQKYGYRIIEMETDKNHVHILLDYSHKTAVSVIVKQFKMYSTGKMWQLYENALSRFYWKQKVLWSEGYFACSVGQVSQKATEMYIRNQG